MWFKIDDKWWSNRKTRKMLRSHPDIRRDPAPHGLWSLAGDWCADNGTDGFIPEDELEQWADDWKALAARIVDAGFWVPATQHGESGYQFNDWDEYQPTAYEREQLRQKRSEAGRLGGLRSAATRRAQANAQANGEALASTKPEPRPVPSRPERLMADPVSHLQVVGARGEKLTDSDLERIATATNGDTTHAIRTASFILDRAPSDVRNPGAYVLAAIRDEPAAYRYHRGAPKKSEQCPHHPGEWAGDGCRPCAADRKVEGTA